MSENKPVSLEEETKNLDIEFKALAKKIGVSNSRLLQLLIQKELFFMNNQLTAIHEHFDMQQKKKAKNSE